MENETQTPNAASTDAPDTGRSDADSGAASSEPDVDVEALRESMAQAGEEASLRTTVANLQRAVGHIPGLQKSLADANTKLARLDAAEASVRQLSTTLNDLISSLPEGVVPARVAESLRPRAGDTNSEVLEKIERLGERIDKATTPEETRQPTPEEVAARAQWDIATHSVEQYAARNSFDHNLIPREAWQAAMAANPNDPAQAAMNVIRWIDAERAKEGRREEKKDASTGTTATSGRSTGRTGPVTLDSMRNMTAQQIMAIPVEERMAALAAAGN